MLTLDQLSKRMPVRLYQKQREQIDPSVIAEQLQLNGWLHEQLVDVLLKDAKEYVITTFPTDYGIEAVVSGTPAKSTEEPVNFPGFYAATHSADVTPQKELERAVKFVGRKYISRFGLLKEAPISYRIDSVKPLVKDKKAIVHVSHERLADETEREYWETYVTPELTVRYDDGRAVRVLAEAYEHHCKSVSRVHTSEEAWARHMTNLSLYSLLEMMKAHGRMNYSVQKYRTNKGIFKMDNLDFSAFYDPEIRQQIFAGKQNVSVPLKVIEKVSG